MSVFFINPFSFAAADGDFESIATVTVGSGGASSIEFTSIDSGWQHLQLRGVFRSTQAATRVALKVTLNGDTGSNYARHNLSGLGDSAIAGAATNASDMQFPSTVPGANSTATSGFGAAIVDILDYASTSKFKTLRLFHGADHNDTEGIVAISSGLWRSTSAITSIKIELTGTGNHAQHTTAALYGIKAP